MTDLGNEEARGLHVELCKHADTIVQRSLTLHELFDQEWEKPSYHNQYHVEATLKTIDAVFDSMNMNDPLELRGQIYTWNEAHPDFQIPDPALLRQAFRIAFACHDVGNITADEPINQQGEIVFADAYQSAGAEERSKKICKKFINDLCDNHPQRDLVEALALHIIEQTKVGGEMHHQRPFWTLVQTIDQIGSAYFSRHQNEELVAGLIEEGHGGMNLQLAQMIGFANARLVTLIPDQHKREATVVLFEKNSYGHTRSSFVVDPALGDVNRIASDGDIPLLLQVAQGKNGTSGILV